MTGTETVTTGRPSRPETGMVVSSTRILTMVGTTLARPSGHLVPYFGANDNSTANFTAAALPPIAYTPLAAGRGPVRPAFSGGYLLVAALALLV